MAYQVTRKNRIKEELQLCRADGSIAESIIVDLNVDEITARVNKAYEALGMAQDALQKDPNSEKTIEAYGAAVVSAARRPDVVLVAHRRHRRPRRGIYRRPARLQGRDRGRGQRSRVGFGR